MQPERSPDEQGQIACTRNTPLFELRSPSLGGPSAAISREHPALPLVGDAGLDSRGLGLANPLRPGGTPRGAGSHLDDLQLPVVPRAAFVVLHRVAEHPADTSDDDQLNFKEKELRVCLKLGMQPVSS